MYRTLIRKILRVGRTAVRYTFAAVWDSPLASLLLSGGVLAGAYQLWVYWPAVELGLQQLAPIMEAPRGGCRR